MQKRTIINVCLVSLFVLSVLWVIGRWHTPAWQNNPMFPLLAILVLAIWGGVMFVTIILPSIGDAVGTVMYSSGEAVTKSEGLQAAAKLAAGDYEGAIQAYEVVMKEKPDDPFPISEIGKILAEKLNDPRRALAFVQKHLEAQSWSEEHAAFLMFRMVDIHMHSESHAAAKELLGQIVGNFPGTRHSSNAKHKIQEIEQAEFKAIQARRARGEQV